jgi:hypothetical protein
VVLLIGGNRLYLHYVCGKCSEVWTVTDAVRPTAHSAAHCFEAALTIGETH